MMDQLKNLVRDNAKEAIFNNSDVPDDKNEEAVNATSNSIVDVLKDKVSSGEIKDILSSGDQKGSSQLGSDIMKNLTSKLGDLGIGGKSAQNIASSVVPVVLSKIFQSGNGGSSIDLKDLIGHVSDGNFDLSSLGSMLGGGKKGGKDDGGLLGKAKDLF